MDSVEEFYRENECLALQVGLEIHAVISHDDVFRAILGVDDDLLEAAVKGTQARLSFPMRGSPKMACESAAW